jgi:hypothetical protein
MQRETYKVIRTYTDPASGVLVKVYDSMSEEMKAYLAGRGPAPRPVGKHWSNRASSNGFFFVPRTLKG